MRRRADDPAHKQKAVYSHRKAIELVPLLVHMGGWRSEAYRAAADKG